MFVDTDAPEVREWAKAVYEAYAFGAVLLEEYTQRGFQEAMERKARMETD